MGLGAACLLLVGLPDATASDLKSENALVPAKTKVRFSGIDASKGSLSAYGGILFAPRGLDGPSFALRLVTSAWMGFDFRDDAAPAGGLVRVEQLTGDFDVQIGFRSHADGWHGGIYLGARWHQHQSIDDGGNPSDRGQELGLKVDAELSHYPREALPIFMYLRGSYATVADSYWTRIQIGVRSGAVTFGPELALLGDEGYDQWRVGVFAHFDLPVVHWHVALSAGWAAYRRPAQHVEDLPYGALGLARSF